MSDQRRIPKVVVNTPYPRSSDEDQPGSYMPKSSSPHSPKDHKNLWAHGSGGIPTGSSSRGRIGTDGTTTEREDRGVTGVRMVTRSPPADPRAKPSSYYPQESRHGPGSSQLEVGQYSRPRSRSIGRMVKNEDNSDDDSPPRRSRNPSMTDKEDRYTSRHSESDRLGRGPGRDEERLTPISRARDSSRRPSPYPDDREDPRGRGGYDDDRQGPSDTRTLARQLVLRGLSQARSDRGSRRDDFPRPRSPSRDPSPRVESQELVKIHPRSERDEFDRYADCEHRRGDPRQSGVSFRDADESRRPQLLAARTSYDDSRERAEVGRYSSQRYFDYTENARGERRRGYEDVDRLRVERVGGRDVSRPGSDIPESGRLLEPNSRYEEDRWGGRLIPRRESDEAERDRRSGTTSRRDEYDPRRLQPRIRDVREVSPLPRHLEPVTRDREQSTETRTRTYYYPSDPPADVYSATNLRPSKGQPSRSRARSPGPPARDPVKGSSRVSVGRESETSEYGGSGVTYDQDDYQPLRQASPLPQLGESAWERKLERRGPPLQRDLDGGSSVDRGSEPRSIGSAELTRPERDKGKRRAEEVPTRPPPNRAADPHERDHYIDHPARVEGRNKLTEKATSSSSESELTRVVTTRRGDAEPAITLEKTARASTTALDAWRTNALEKVEVCSNHLNEELQRLFRYELSGSKRSRSKGWGEIYNWRLAEGEKYFRDDRKEFVRTTSAKMTEMVETVYSSYLKDGKNEIPPSNFSIQPSIKSSMNGKKSVSVLPSATITVGQWTKAAPIVKPKTFDRRSRWS